MGRITYKLLNSSDYEDEEEDEDEDEALRPAVAGSGQGRLGGGVFVKEFG